ncbi:MAG: hypothetical protein Q9181_007812 [Wetmoreana brouardii]
MYDPDPRELEYPPKDIIKAPSSQAWMFENMFNEEQDRFLPHARYTYRVLKQLFAILEEVSENDALELDEEDIEAETSETGPGAVVRKLVREETIRESANDTIDRHGKGSHTTWVALMVNFWHRRLIEGGRRYG